MAAARWETVIAHGLAGGLVSGLLFSAAESVAAPLQGSSWDAPLRLVAAVALGPDVLAPSGSSLPVLGWGMALHLLYTAAAGVVLAWLLSARPESLASGARTLAAGLVYAALLWLSNVYLVAPLLGWWWFPDRTLFLPQLFLQVGVWGGAQGAYFARSTVRAALAGPPRRAAASPRRV